MGLKIEMRLPAALPKKWQLSGKTERQPAKTRQDYKCVSSNEHRSTKNVKSYK